MNGTREVWSWTSGLVYYDDTQRRTPENLANAMTARGSNRQITQCTANPMVATLVRLPASLCIEL
jgi:hypothetical protein